LEAVAFFADLIGSLDELDAEVLDFEAAFLGDFGRHLEGYRVLFRGGRDMVSHMYKQTDAGMLLTSKRRK
jgi:hypothetical protein